MVPGPVVELQLGDLDVPGPGHASGQGGQEGEGQLGSGRRGAGQVKIHYGKKFSYFKPMLRGKDPFMTGIGGRLGRF